MNMRCIAVGERNAQAAKAAAETAKTTDNKQPHISPITFPTHDPKPDQSTSHKK